MILRVITVVNGIAKKRYTEMLRNGAFPEVRYEEAISEDGFKSHSYSLFEYSDVWATFMKVLDAKIKEELNDELGIFTRKHSKAFLAKIEKFCAGITESEVAGYNDRFHNFADDVRGYAKDMIAKDKVKAQAD